MNEKIKEIRAYEIEGTTYIAKTYEEALKQLSENKLRSLWDEPFGGHTVSADNFIEFINENSTHILSYFTAQQNCIENSVLTINADNGSSAGKMNIDKKCVCPNCGHEYTD